MATFVDDFHLETNLILDRKTFIYALTRSPHPSSMAYELLQDCIVPNDYANNPFFFEIFEHIIRGHVFPSISHLFIGLQLLALEKQDKGVQPITIVEVNYQLVTHTLPI